METIEPTAVDGRMATDTEERRDDEENQRVLANLDPQRMFISDNRATLSRQDIRVLAVHDPHAEGLAQVWADTVDIFLNLDDEHTRWSMDSQFEDRALDAVSLFSFCGTRARLLEETYFRPLTLDISDDRFACVGRLRHMRARAWYYAAILNALLGAFMDAIRCCEMAWHCMLAQEHFWQHYLDYMVVYTRLMMTDICFERRVRLAVQHTLRTARCWDDVDLTSFHAAVAAYYRRCAAPDEPPDDFFGRLYAQRK